MKKIACLGNVLPQILLAAIYFSLAVIVLEFAVIKGNATLIWPASGLALATLIRLGAQYAIGIFIGAIAAGIYAGDMPIIWWMTATGNVLEPLLALFILRYLPFSKNIYHYYEYLSLLYAGMAGAIVSALLGVTSLLLAGFIPLEQFVDTLLHWWAADALGIAVVTPFLLLFDCYQVKHLLQKKAIEAGLLSICSLLTAFSVLAGWQSALLMPALSDYILIIPLIWAAIRFGQTISSLIVAEYFIVGIYGLLIHQGLFIGSDAEPDLPFFCAYFTLVSLATMLIAYVANERNILYQAINISQAETYIFCEEDIHFQFVNQCALDNQGLSLFSALKLTPLDLQMFASEQQLREMLQPLRGNAVTAVDFETTLQRADGSFYPVEVHIQRVEYSNRHCYLVSAMDIKERLEKENYLTLGNYVCELSPQAIMITDKHNQIIRVNAAFSAITGYSAQTAIGKTPGLLSSGWHDCEFYQSLWQTVQTAGEWSGEIYNRRANGELYWQNITIKVLHNPDGSVENYIAMFTDITQERAKALQLKHLAEHDVLTDLPNKSLLHQSFQHAVATAKRQGTKLGVLFIDLNDFKPINDQYGHPYGDAVLQILAARMQAYIRETDVIARVGGDEFVILMTNIETKEACQILSTKIKSVVVEPIIVEGISLHVSASIGMAIYPEQGEHLEALLSAADMAMYADKQQMKTASS